jgi:hypothetical protein
MILTITSNWAAVAAVAGSDVNDLKESSRTVQVVVVQYNDRLYYDS